MIRNKKITCLVLAIIIGSFVGCTSKEKYKDIKLDLYDSEKGKAIATDYLDNICNGNIEEANKLCSEDLLKANKTLDEGVSKIISYQIDRIVGGNDFSYYIFNVIRSSKVEPKSDLESYTIKVTRDDKNYSIDEVKSKVERELFITNKSLRIIGENAGKSNLIINLHNFPKDAYTKSNKIMLYKGKVPTDTFGKVSLGFRGKKVAISTKNNDTTFISIGLIDDSLMKEAGVEVAPLSSGSSDTEALEDILEKPVISKLISVDLLEDINIDKFIFSKDDSNLAVNYKNDKDIMRVNIYSSDDGSPIETNFKETFSEDKYNIEGKSFDEGSFKFKVYTNDQSEDDRVGEYEVNLKTLELKKL